MPSYGIAMGWVIANSAQQTEVLRYNDSSGNPSTGTETSIAIVVAGSMFFTDLLPNDSTFRHYRVRHVVTGYANGAYSNYIRAKPGVIPQYGDPDTFQTTI